MTSEDTMKVKDVEDRQTAGRAGRDLSGASAILPVSGKLLTQSEIIKEIGRLPRITEEDRRVYPVVITPITKLTRD